MAYDKVIDSTKLDTAMSETANAIRSKNGKTDKIAWDESTGFKNAVEAIEIKSELNLIGLEVVPTKADQIFDPPENYDGFGRVTVTAMPTATQATPTISVNSSGLITASATQTAGYVAAGTKSGTKQLTTQAAKTVTPSTSSQTAVASGVYTTGAVTVAAIPSTYVKPTATKSATTYTPTTSNQTIAAGTYCSGTQTIKGDSNLVAANIKSGVSIFGVAGSLVGGGIQYAEGSITSKSTSTTSAGTTILSLTGLSFAPKFVLIYAAGNAMPTGNYIALYSEYNLDNSKKDATYLSVDEGEYFHSRENGYVHTLTLTSDGFTYVTSGTDTKFATSYRYIAIG